MYLEFHFFVDVIHFWKARRCAIVGPTLSFMAEAEACRGHKWQ